MLSKPFLLGCFCACSLLAVSVSAEDKKTTYDTTQLPPAADKQGVTFDTDIKPIFTKSCIKCHGADTPKPKGKLRLDTLEQVMKGGEDGAAVVPGDIAKSPLLANVAHLGDEDDFMPPPKNKAGLKALSKDQVGLIRAWIEQGCK